MHKLNQFPHILWLLLLGGLFSFTSTNTMANTQSIAKVILSTGDVTAINSNGEIRPLKRRGKIFSGDTLNTGIRARCQLRFSDGSLISLPEQSEFRIEEYQYNGKQDGSEKGVYSLLKGGMRTLTGAIGKKNKQNYQLNTPVATIGIRGTAYHLYLHQQTSGETELYGRVDNGEIDVVNSSGSTPFGREQNFYIPGKGEQARSIMVLPAFYPTENESLDESDDGDTTETITEEGGEVIEESLTSEETLVAEVELTSDDTLTLDSTVLLTTDENLTQSTTATTVSVTNSGTLAPAGAIMGIAFTMKDPVFGIDAASGMFANTFPNEFYIDTIDGVGNVPVSGMVYFPPDPLYNDSGCDPCTFSYGTATLSDTGGDPIGVNWGRWTGDYIIVENGVVEQTTGSMHYIYSPNVTPLSVVQAMTGTMNYSLAGGTKPTDHLGNVGSLNSFTMDVDFTSQAVTGAQIDLVVAGKTINATLVDGIPIPLSTALDNNGGVHVTTSDFTVGGHIDMQFLGPNADAIAASYGFRDTDTTSSSFGITGTALLK